jgi:hypothetical protein
LKYHVLIVLIFTVVVQTIASARECLMMRPATAEQTEIDAERALEKIDSYFRQRGFHSSVIHERTTSGASAGSSVCRRVFAHLRSMCDKRWQVRAVPDL